MKEADLIQLAQQGDRDAYAKLMTLHYRTVEKFAFQIGVRGDDVGDVTQEVFIKLYRFLHQFRQDRFTTWLYKITLNTARDYYRKESRELAKEERAKDDNELMSQSPSAEARILVFEEDQELHNAIQLLDEKYRIPLTLFYFQDLSYEEIAEILNISLASVKTRLFRAKDKLKRAIGEKGGSSYGR